MLRAGTARLLPDSVDEGERLLRRANALVSPFGTTKTLARCLIALASARLFAGDLPQARSLHDQAIGIYRELGEISAPPAVLRPALIPTPARQLPKRSPAWQALSFHMAGRPPKTTRTM